MKTQMTKTMYFTIKRERALWMMFLIVIAFFALMCAPAIANDTMKGDAEKGYAAQDLRAEKGANLGTAIYLKGEGNLTESVQQGMQAVESEGMKKSAGKLTAMARNEIKTDGIYVSDGNSLGTSWASGTKIYYAQLTTTGTDQKIMITFMVPASTAVMNTAITPLQNEQNWRAMDYRNDIRSHESTLKARFDNSTAYVRALAMNTGNIRRTQYWV